MLNLVLDRRTRDEGTTKPTRAALGRATASGRDRAPPVKYDGGSEATPIAVEIQYKILCGSSLNAIVYS